MISFRARFVRFVTRKLVRKFGGDPDIPRLRETFESVAARARSAAGTRVKYVDIAGVECDWLVPGGCQDAPVLLYLHGGAYVSGSSKTHRPMVSHIAAAAGMRALLPNYRLAPENPFPAGLNDCVKVYLELLNDGMDPANIAIAGDSAGGGMTMAVLLSLRDAGAPLPNAVVLLSPWLDLTGGGESVQSRADEDPLFDGKDMPRAAAHYAPAEELENPLISPVFADVHGLPPTLIQVGDHEILLSDSTRIAEKMTAEDVQVTLQVWRDMWHVFQFFVGRMPEAERAISDIATYLRARFVRGEETVANKAA
ncbi:MAG: alpha/beta hydrolase [Pseudomonadota bacterium]